MRNTFSIEEAARLSGLTSDTLKNWIRARLFFPSVQRGSAGRGYGHQYSFRDLVALRVAAELRRRGISMAELRRVLAYLKKRTGLGATDALASTLLVTDSHDVYEVSEGMSFSALRAPGQSIIALATLVNEVQRGVRELDAA